MAKWKLLRQEFGTEEFTFLEGKEVSVGRDTNNTVTLKSLVVSRYHCIINFKKSEALITDLNSSNGVYVGCKKIPPNVPFSVQDGDLIGLGWTYGVQNIENSQKFLFKLVMVKSISERIKFQNENEYDLIEAEIVSISTKKELEAQEIKRENTSPILNSSRSKKKLSLKIKNKENVSSNNKNPKSEEIITLSDSDCEKNEKEYVKSSPTINDNIPCGNIKQENNNLEYEAFNIKQEYLGYDEEPIQIVSDSDSESEHWLLRLSQNSPGKPFINVKEKLQTPTKDSSYSQLDDDFFEDLAPNHQQNDQNKCDSDEFIEDLITLTMPTVTQDRTEVDEHLNEVLLSINDDNVHIEKPNTTINKIENISKNKDKITSEIGTASNETIKKIQIIDPLVKPLKRKAQTITEGKPKTSFKSKKAKKCSPKKNINHSQKEQRKIKLKEIANKDKNDSTIDKNLTNNANKSIVNVKVTSTNRGAFLTNVVQANVKSLKKKDNNVETITNTSKGQKKEEPKVALKYIRPLIDKDESEKPVSRVQPLQKTKKKVRFSNNLQEVHEFQIEPGNNLKKTSSVKTAYMDILHRAPVYSLEKITLMKILRWNPQWLTEQQMYREPPPILGHNNRPMQIFHSFESHEQYVHMVGDLLLMEIWECITQAFLKTNVNYTPLMLKIECLPPIPPQERYFELINLSVNTSMQSSELKYLPRVGEILMIEFGPEKSLRFFYVHNVRNLPSPPNNKYSFFSISLYSTFTEKMRLLKPGDTVKGRVLAYIHKELSLFEAIDRLAISQLRDAILKPEPNHFTRLDGNPTNMDSQWTVNLNTSQKAAVSASVTAALSNRPSIQMVQGPPGTGKSSVICAMVMSYFYDSRERRHQNRSKVLICATSNAAVDELVIRLLNIRQSLPKTERFRMVRVGRLEAMNSRARDVSSQQLAQRDVRSKADAQHHGAAMEEEISHLEAKVNMWNTLANEAKDPVRVAYCQGRLAKVNVRLAMLRGGRGSGEPRPEQLVQAERRIIECADIVVTTLGSTQSTKLKGLKGRIALCIVDEAGQAIEPEALVPLTLDVSRLTLVGDPQQLPGFICSQHAKKYGLGESLFSRMASVTENWREGSPVVLLNQQYRMHPAIADYPNRAFYGGRIHNMTASAVDLDVPPYCIVSVSSGDKGQVSSGANEMEAWGVARLVGALAVELRPLRLSVALITPYAAQRDMLRRCLQDLHDDAVSDAVEVNTVDSFQGQERDVVVISVARSHGVGFLTDVGRMNVMLTRARRALVVCLNPLALMRNNQWRTLIEDAQRRYLYTSLPNKMCQRGTADTLSTADVLQCIKRLKPKRKS